MVNFEKAYAQQDGFLSKLTNVIFPITLIGAFGKSTSPLEKEFRWNWAFNSKEEKILVNMKSTASRLLKQSGYHNLLIVDIAPRGPSILSEDMRDIGRIMRLNVYISRLNRKYYDRLIPELQGIYGKSRIYFIDVFNRFYANLLLEGASFYYQLDGSTFLDGMHYGSTGNQEFALMITAKMLRIGWFKKDPNITDAMLDGISAGIPMDLSGVCDLKCWAVICKLTKVCKFTDLLKMHFDSMLDQDFWTEQEAYEAEQNQNPNP